MKKNKRWILIIVIIAITVIAITLIANSVVKKKIAEIIDDKLPVNIELSYQDISVNSLTGSLAISKLSIQIKNKEDSLLHTRASLDQFKISGISYWDYLVNNEIHFKELNLSNLKVDHYKDHITLETDSMSKSELQLPMPIQIDRISYKNSTVRIFDNTEDSLFFYIKNLNANIHDLRSNNTLLQNKIPFEFGKIEMDTDSLFLKVNPYDNLIIASIKLIEEELTINGLEYSTKYSRKELSRIIPTERDHFDLKIKSITFHDMQYGVQSDTLFNKTILIEIDQANANIYRDKLVADDPSIKKMYSQIIRDLPIKTTIDSVSIIDAAVTYSEKVYAENDAGSLVLHSINGGISNLSNTYQAPTKTDVMLNGIFLINTPIQIRVSMDVSDPNDSFEMIGEYSNFNMADINRYTLPNMNAELEGHVSEAYFTIVGNKYSSYCDMSMNYKGLKVQLYNKKKRRKKVILSTIANQIIKKDSKKNEYSFNKSNIKAKRDESKSFINFAVLNIIKATTDIFTKNRNKKSKK